MPTKNIVTANVVIVAAEFNVSIFNQFWFLKHSIFSEDEITKAESVFTPAFIQMDAPDCHLLVVPERIQMTMKDVQKPEGVLPRIAKIVETLPETPYTALGLNMIWNLSIGDKEDVGAFTHRNFSVPEHPLFKHFSSPDAKFGSYLSQEFDTFRLRLDIKPQIITTAQGRHETVHLNFNFHLDLEGMADKAETIKTSLAKWAQAFKETEAITDKLI